MRNSLGTMGSEDSRDGARGRRGVATSVTIRPDKPGNILFDRHGTVYLADFGIIKALQPAGCVQTTRALTGTGLVLGTADYMAPELCDGRPFDGRVDQYALAATVYELLTGQAPFSATTPLAVLVRQMHDKPRLMHEVNPSIPQGISQAVDRALSKSPEDRYGSCGQFARAVLAAAERRETGPVSVAETTAQTPPPLPPVPALPTRVEPAVSAAVVGPVPAGIPWSYWLAGGAAGVSILAVQALLVVVGFRDRGVSTAEGPPPPAPVVLEDVPVPAVPPVPAVREPPSGVEEDPFGTSPSQPLLPPPKTPAAPTAPAVKSAPADPPKASAPSPPQRPSLAVAPFDAAAAKRHQQAWASYLGQPVEVTNSIGMKLVLIPPGEFLMGSPASEAERDSDETQHRVRITKPYYLGMCEVTQAEYERVMGTNPSRFKTVAGQTTSRFPVEQVSWEDAMEFCRKLSALPGELSAGRAYRLPTEAEWEFACRAGTTTTFHFGSQWNGREANCNGNHPYGTTTKGPYLERTTTVGSYASNGFGLYDMHGNVWEWRSDWYGAYATTTVDDPSGRAMASVRVCRGGSWTSDAGRCRSADRLGPSPSSRNDLLGFRLAAV